MTQRSLDAGRPFGLWAPADDPDAPHCGHGVWVEAELDAPDGTILLAMRLAERHGDSAHVRIERASISLDLSSGAYEPRDELASRLLAEELWLGPALAGHLDLLRERALRVSEQRRQVAPLATALEQAELGTMIPYDQLFPAAWDLIVQHDGHTYWVVDHHCPKQGCDCAQIVTQLHRIEGLTPRSIGNVRFDLPARRNSPQASSPLAADVFAKVWKDYGDELVRRHRQVREALRGRAITETTPQPTPAPVGLRVPRNAPCPCGSGKKYKRCCAGRALDSSRP
jgi:hypothetical protein